MDAQQLMDSLKVDSEKHKEETTETKETTETTEQTGPPESTEHKEEKKETTTEEKGKETEEKKEFDFSAFGEDVTSPEDAVNKYKNITSEYSSVKEKSEALENQIKDYDEKLSKVKSEIDDPVLYRLNKVKKDNPESYDLYKRIALNDDISSTELLRMKLIQDNPDLKDHPDKVQAYIEDQYGLDLKPLDPDEYDEHEVSERKRKIETNQLRLQMEANKVRKEYMSEFEEIELPKDPEKPLTEEEQEAKQQELVKAWNPVLEKLPETFTEIPITFKGQNDKDAKEFMKYQIPEKDRESFGEMVKDYVTKHNIPLTKETVKQVGSFLYSQVFQKNLPYIYSSIITKARTMEADEWDKIIHNSSALKPQERKTPEQTKHQESDAKLNKMLGING